MLRRLDRYILREIAVSWLAVTGILLVILVTNQVAQVLGRAADNHFPREIILALIGFSSLQYLTILVPIGLLLGIVLAFGRLYHESEMAAVQACGVGMARLYLPVMILAVAMAVLLGWLALVMSPKAAQRGLELRGLAIRDAQFGDLQPGKFRSLGKSGAVFYAGAADPDGTLRQVFVKRNQGDRLEIAVADRARHVVSEGGLLHTFILEQGRLYEVMPGNPEARISEFREYGIPVRLNEASIDSQKLEIKSTADLLRSSKPEERAELQWRLSMPLMALVLSILAVPLSKLRPRQGRYARVGFAILLYFVYSNLLTAGKAWVVRGTVPSALGLWWVHAVMIALAIAVLAGPSLRRRFA